MEQLASKYSKSGPVIFNLSKHAGSCPTIPYITIGDVDLPDDKPDIFVEFNQIDTNARIQELDHLKLEARQAANGFRTVRKRCKEALRFIQKATQEKNASSVNHCNQQLEKIDKRLAKEAPQYLRALECAAGYSYPRITRHEVLQGHTELQMLRWAHGYYTAVDHSASSMLVHLDMLASRIGIRENELSENPSIADLLNSWAMDNTPGRAQLLLNKVERLKTAKIDNSSIELLENAQKRFIHSLQADSVETSTSPKRGIHLWMRTLLHLFNKNKKTELQSLLDALQTDDWLYPAIRTFTAALIAELETDTVHAMSLYQGNIDYCTEKLERAEFSSDSLCRIVEECLLRMTHNHIVRADTHAAMTTMGLLSEISPQYSVGYAKLLVSSGRSSYARDLLQVYTRSYPEDSGADDLLAEINGELPPSEENSVIYKATIRDALTAIMGDDPEKPDIAA